MDEPSEKDPTANRDVLLEAIKAGALPEQAAACIQQSGPWLATYVEADKKYEKEIEQARALGFVDVLRRVRGIEQVQAMKLLLDTCYAPEIRAMQMRKPAMTDEQIQAIMRAVAMNMTEDQVARIGEVLELGRVADNRRKAIDVSPPTESCPQITSNPSSAILPRSSAAPATLPAAQEDCETSSDSPGT